LVAFRQWQSRGLRVLVFPEGLLRIQGDAATTAKWEEINTVRREALHVYRRVFQPKLVLQRLDGTEMEFHSLPKEWGLIDVVEEETLRRLLPQALLVYQSGQALSFGDLQLCRGAISYKNKSLPISEVKKIEVKDQTLVVETESRFWPVVIDLSNVPNYHLLKAVIDSVGTDNADRA
jgi:hypothetical protein